MIFLKSSAIEPPARQLAEAIARQLSDGKRVLWLVPGGSAISVAVYTASLLQRNFLANLTVTLTDERYGEVGHADSNWYQLMERGFALPEALLRPVLMGGTAEQTVRQFDGFLREQLAAADYAIGLFGIGADGHTAGILPDSPALQETAFAHGYQTEPFYRITLTPPALAQLDEAVVFAQGEEKQPVLDQLEENIPIRQQPAQLLKQIPRLTIYNGYKGGAA